MIAEEQKAHENDTSTENQKRATTREKERNSQMTFNDKAYHPEGTM